MGCSASNSEDLMKCLREADAAKLVKSDIGLRIEPTVDGDFITEQPEDLLKAGKYNKVPTLFSTTSGKLRQYPISSTPVTGDEISAMK